jgi:hypothetical protein
VNAPQEPSTDETLPFVAPADGSERDPGEPAGPPLALAIAVLLTCALFGTLALVRIVQRSDLFAG